MDNPMMGGGGLFPGSAAGMLDLDPSIHHRHQLRHQTQAAPHLHPIHSAGGLDPDHSMALFEPSRSPSSAAQKGGAFLNPFRGKGITCSATTSDDDDDHDHDHIHTADDSHPNGATRGKKASPWQRMKWTDEVVRLLINLVAYVGDDGTPESAADGPPAKRKCGAALQKKGKWKTVSKLMLEKGCYVSPQQCEDKFNDLNKRYKRLNEILGRGTTCRVVESPSLLDSMTHISAKAKDDVRKILSSKHLFYREMCAYHNGQRIAIPSCQDFNLEGCGPMKVDPLKDRNGLDDGNEDDDDDDDEENEDDAERNDEFGNMGYDSLQIEIDGVLRDPAKSPWEQREWFRKRALQLQEERVEIQAEAFELEKRRLKWQRFCSKKDRELDRLRLENERLRLENERMVMQVRQKEMELDSKRIGEPSEFASLRVDGEQGRVP